MKTELELKRRWSIISLFIMTVRLPIAALVLATFMLIAPSVHAQELRDRRAHIPKTVSETDTHLYPTVAEVEEIRALPPSSLVVPDTFYGAHPDFIILLPCLEMYQNPSNGNSLILRNRCNFGLMLEGSVVSANSAGKCLGVARNGRRADDFYVTLLPGKQETDFSNYENCLNHITFMRIWTPEAVFEQVFGPKITELALGEFNSDGFLGFQNVQTFNRPKLGVLAKSNLCVSKFSTLESERDDSFRVNWRSAVEAKIGENYVQVRFYDKSWRRARIYFEPDIDRQAVADVINRIMYRCSGK